MSYNNGMSENTSQISDHDLLIMIDTKMGFLISDNNEYKKQIGVLEEKKIDRKEANEIIQRQTNSSSEFQGRVNKTLTDYEKRIRKMERIAWVVSGALLILEIIFKK